MTSVVLYSLILTGFTVSFLHAALPTHWFPFVMTARAMHWSKSKALVVTLLAGLGHILLTTLLGVLIVWAGVSLDDKIGRFFPVLAGGALIAFGIYNLALQIRGRHHHHIHGATSTVSQKAAIISLVTLLTFSPCESFLPIYLSGLKFGWTGFVILSLILAVGTLAGMVIFTTLSLMGLEKIKFAALEKYEHLTMGVVLCLVGALVMVVEA